MFNKNKNEQEPSALDKEIDKILLSMKETKEDDAYHDALLTKLERLYKIKLSDQPEKKTVSPDALVAAGASIGGIVLILGYERLNVLTSKAMQFLVKPRL